MSPMKDPDKPGSRRRSQPVPGLVNGLHPLLTVLLLLTAQLQWFLTFVAKKDSKVILKRKPNKQTKTKHLVLFGKHDSITTWYFPTKGICLQAHLNNVSHISKCNITPSPAGNDFAPRRYHRLHLNTPPIRLSHNILLEAEKVLDKILHKHIIKIPYKLESEISEADKGYLPEIYYKHFTEW